MNLQACEDKEIWPSHIAWMAENQIKIIEKYSKMKTRFKPFASSNVIRVMEKINFE